MIIFVLLRLLTRCPESAYLRYRHLDSEMQKLRVRRFGWVQVRISVSITIYPSSAYRHATRNLGNLGFGTGSAGAGARSCHQKTGHASCAFRSNNRELVFLLIP
jgi:hypothetical protein